MIAGKPRKLDDTTYPEIAEAVLAELASRLRRSTVYTEHLSNHSVHQRVVRLLLVLAEDYGVIDNKGAIRIDLGLTQDQMASMFGTTRETINRELSKLRDQKVIRSGHKQIIIRNLVQLKQLLELP